jgi:hypothetical protein
MKSNKLQTEKTSFSTSEEQIAPTYIIYLKSNTKRNIIYWTVVAKDPIGQSRAVAQHKHVQRLTRLKLCLDIMAQDEMC